MGAVSETGRLRALLQATEGAAIRANIWFLTLLSKVLKPCAVHLIPTRLSIRGCQKKPTNTHISFFFWEQCLYFVAPPYLQRHWSKFQCCSGENEVFVRWWLGISLSPHSSVFNLSDGDKIFRIEGMGIIRSLADHSVLYFFFLLNGMRFAWINYYLL